MPPSRLHRLLSRPSPRMTRLTLVLPLYIYPSPGAWEPLFAAAASNPDVLFVCVVNPNSGPGQESLPDVNYRAALGKLSRMSNIQLIGYVHCQYAARDPDIIKREIEVYGAWEAASCGEFHIDGIFIDEAPWECTHRTYMADLATYIRQLWCSTETTRATDPPTKPDSTAGAGRPRGLVVYNPGVVVDKGYLEDADLVVVFEQSHQRWCNYFLNEGLCQVPAPLRHKVVAMIHSFGVYADGVNLPSKREGKSATALASEIRKLGFGGLYITEQLDGGYNEWPTSWLPVACSVGEMNRNT